MVTISVPITPQQERFIKDLVKSGKAANKAHAMRMGIDALAEDEAYASLQRSLQDAKEGRVFSGDLDALAEKLRS